MLIECLVKREAAVEVPISSDVYVFDFDEYGRRVAEVYKESHIECFLALPQMYREVPAVPPGAAAPAKKNGRARPENSADPADGPLGKTNGEAPPVKPAGVVTSTIPEQGPTEPLPMPTARTDITVPTGRKELFEFLKRNGVHVDPTLTTAALREKALAAAEPV